jgi:hypothetical protein
MGEGARNAKRKLCNGKRASAALERKHKGRGRQTLSVTVKIHLASPIGFIVSRGVLSGAHAPRALTAGKNLGRRRAGPTTTEAAACLHACYHYGAVTGGPQQAVMSACPRRPLRARPRRMTVAATAGIKWPGPLTRKTLEWPEPQAQTKPTLEGCKHRPVASKPVPSKRAPQVQSIDEKLLISGSRAGTAENPRSPQMRKDRGTLLLPRAALLIRGSTADLRRVRTGAPDHQSQGRRGRAHSSLSSSPPARGPHMSCSRASEGS